MTGGKPPMVSNIVEMIKNSFSEFEGDNGAESVSGNVSSQALSACLVLCRVTSVPWTGLAVYSGVGSSPQQIIFPS
jgi:hypothetical protein